MKDGAPSMAALALQAPRARYRRPSCASCIPLALVTAVIAAGACTPPGAQRQCDVPEPECGVIADQAAEWAAISRPGVPIVRIRVLAHRGYEIHYDDGAVEAIVP